jgi:hypothetical protein
VLDFIKTYAYHIIDFFLPMIFVCLYFPIIMSKKTEVVAIKLWDWLMVVAFNVK